MFFINYGCCFLSPLGIKVYSCGINNNYYLFFIFMSIFFSLISNFVPRVLRVFGWHVITLQPVHILGTRLLFSINKLFLILLN